MKPESVLLDLLMAVMDSPRIWTDAAGGVERGLAWRDAVTRHMITSRRYVAYEGLVAAGAEEVGLAPSAVADVLDGWDRMQPWPDAAALEVCAIPYAFVTNCSRDLALRAASRSGLSPRFTLSAEEAGWYKPSPEIYRQACERIGSTLHRTLFVAGAPYDAEGAAAAGLCAGLVLRRPLIRGLEPGIRRFRSLEAVMAAAAG